MHFMVDQKFAQAIARFLKRERQLIREKRALLLDASQIKRPPDQT
jgi:predicted N-acyltransferase